MEGLKKLQERLDRIYNKQVRVIKENNCIVVSGHLDSWDDIIEACRMCVSKDKKIHVVNDIVLDGVKIPSMRLPKIHDASLNEQQVDVLIIGGGISGASIARELSKWDLDILLVEKECDLAMQASGRNDGEVHPGVDLGKGSLKQKYVIQGNKIYEDICKELDVPFKRCGQYVGFYDPKLKPIVSMYALQRKLICKVDGTKVISKEEMLQNEPNMNEDFAFCLYNPTAGVVCPYGLTIAYGENAIQNGAKISLNTAVTDMVVSNHKIKAVITNRGIIYPKVVINAAGVWAEEIARMAEDRFYSIHPRRGTDLILDQKSGSIIKSVASFKSMKKDNSHSKGGGCIHTVHDNILLGPDAVETYEKENYATNKESIDAIMQKQSNTSKLLSKKDVITYFTGVRAATFEEDFIIEKGRNTNNLIHVAGIQSPGLTTAPAVAKDVELMAIDVLKDEGCMPCKNASYNPNRVGIHPLKTMDDETRNALIKENPDYGVIVCRCEEISKGEIIDALHRPFVVPTIDAIKKRVRPGMGRCQGGFCMPLVAEIIASECNIPLKDVRKSSDSAIISYHKTKGESHESL